MLDLSGSNESSFCTDGVCCGAACDGVCESCAVSASEGKCTAYALGDDPEMECGADACGGISACRCKNKLTDGAETDIDCGGGVWAACNDLAACGAPGDCTSKVCTNKQCQVSICSEGIINGKDH